MSRIGNGGVLGLVSESTLKDKGSDLTFSGDYGLAVSSNGQALIVLDCTTLDNPVEVDSAGTDPGPSFVQVYGGYAFVACVNSRTFQSFDLSTLPEISVAVDTLEVPLGGRFAVNPNGVACLGGPENAPSANAITLVDLTAPTEMAVLGVIEAGVGGVHRDVAAIGTTHFAIASRDTNEVKVVEAAGVKVVATITGVGEATVAIQYRSPYLYIGSYNDGKVYVYDASKPAEPTLKGSVVAETQIEDMAIAGDFLYASTRFNKKITAINIIDPTSPTIVETFAVPGAERADRLELSGRRLYSLDPNVAKVRVLRSKTTPGLQGHIFNP